MLRAAHSPAPKSNSSLASFSTVPYGPCSSSGWATAFIYCPVTAQTTPPLPSGQKIGAAHMIQISRGAAEVKTMTWLLGHRNWLNLWLSGWLKVAPFSCALHSQFGYRFLGTNNAGGKRCFVMCPLCSLKVCYVVVTEVGAALLLCFTVQFPCFIYAACDTSLSQ